MSEISNRVFLDSLSKRVSLDDFKIWLGALTIVEQKSESVTLNTSSSFHLKKIEESFLPVVREALRECFPTQNAQNLKIFFVVNEKKADAASDERPLESEVFKNSSLPKTEKSAKQEHDSLIDYLNFDRYVCSDFNRVAYELAKRVVDKIGQINPFYIYSSVGLGKTHILHAIGNHLRKKFPFLNILYTTPTQFVDDYSKSLLQKTTHAFRVKYRSVDVLLLDDVQFFIGKEKSCEEFFHLFNEIYTPNKQMVFCSDRMPSDLGGIDERLKSRLTSCVIAEIEPMKEIDKIKILDFYLKENRLSLDPSLYDYVVSSLPNDVRIITGVVKSLVVYEDIYGKDLNIDILKKNLKQLSSNPDHISYNPNKILENVCRYGKISIEELRSPKRDKATSFYRQIAMHLLREKLHLSFSDIGHLLGGKNPSSVHIATKKFVERLKNDAQLNSMLEKILKA